MSNSSDFSMPTHSSENQPRPITHEKGIVTLPDGKKYKIVLGEGKGKLTPEQEAELGDLATKLLNSLEGNKFNDLSQTRITHEGVVISDTKSETSHPTILKPSEGSLLETIQNKVKTILESTELLKATSKNEIGFEPIPQKIQVEVSVVDKKSTTDPIIQNTNRKGSEILKNTGETFRRIGTTIKTKVLRGVEKVKKLVSKKGSGEQPKVGEIIKKMSFPDLQKLFADKNGDQKLAVKGGSLTWVDRNSGIQALGRTGGSKQTKEILTALLEKIDEAIQQLGKPPENVPYAKLSVEYQKKDNADLKKILKLLTENAWIKGAVEHPNNSALKELFQGMQAIAITEAFETLPLTKLLDLVKELKEKPNMKLGFENGNLTLVERSFGIFDSQAGKSATSQQIKQAFLEKLENAAISKNSTTTEELQHELRELKIFKAILSETSNFETQEMQNSWLGTVLIKDLNLKDISTQGITNEMLEVVSKLRENEVNKITKTPNISENIKNFNTLDEIEAGIHKLEESPSVGKVSVPKGFEEKIEEKLNDLQNKVADLNQKTKFTMTDIKELDGHLQELNSISNNKYFIELTKQNEQLKAKASIEPGTLEAINKKVETVVASAVRIGQNLLKDLGDGFQVDPEQQKKNLEGLEKYKVMIQHLKDSPWIAKNEPKNWKQIGGVSSAISKFEGQRDLRKLFPIFLDPQSSSNNLDDIKNVRRNYLCTYRKFQTSQELFQNLRFCLSSGIGDKTLILQTCKEWLEDPFLHSGDVQKEEVRNEISHILSSVENDSSVATDLKNKIEKLNVPQEVKPEIEMTKAQPIKNLFIQGISDTKKRVEITGQIAGGLFIANVDLFDKINTGELFLDQNEKNIPSGQRSNSVVFNNIVVNFNNLQALCTDAIFEAGTTKNKEDAVANALSFFISLAEACLKQNDFSSAYAIYAALSSPQINRLKNCWDKLGTEDQDKFNGIKKVFDPTKNQKNLVDEMSTRGNNTLIPVWGILRRQFASGAEALKSTAGGMHGVGVLLSGFHESLKKIKEHPKSETTVFVELPKVLLYSNDTERNKDLDERSQSIQPRQDKK